MIAYNWKDSEGQSILEVFDIEEYTQTRFVDGEQTYSYKISGEEELEYQMQEVSMANTLLGYKLTKLNI